MIMIAARLRKHFNSSVTQLVVLRRKRILIDTDFAYRRLGRKLSAGEAVNVNLPAVWPRRRPGKRLQLRLEFVGIVGQSLKVFTLDDQRAGVRR